MATRSLINERFAGSVGAKPMTVERQNRSLLDGGLLRRGSPGKALHYNPMEYAYLVLAQAAGQPGDAADIARTLANLCADNGQSLLDWIVAEIELAATPEGQNALRDEIEIGYQRRVPTRELTVSVTGSVADAWISIRNQTETKRDLHSFRVADRELIPVRPRSVRTLTTIRMDLILVAGELLADTPALPKTLIPLPTPGRDGEGDATPETTKAAGPGSHNGLLSGQPALNAQTEPLEKAKSNDRQGSKQSAFGPIGGESQVRHQTTTCRSSRHVVDPNWTDAASP